MKDKIIAISNQIMFRLKDRTLHYEGRNWTKPGAKAYSLEDTGNGLIFHDHFLKKKRKLDYSQAQGLRILLEQLEDDLEMRTYSEE